MIGILDYGMGNISSVNNALNYLGYEAGVITNAKGIERCSHLIVPGVGSYAKAMENIVNLELNIAIMTHVDKGKPLLGICLGMQILSQIGEEGGSATGLGLVSGKVKLLNVRDLPIPHVGWNSLRFNFEHPVCGNLKKNVDFYFVHSYFFNACEKKNVLATTNYGIQFPAIIVRENVVGMQFHPEKSQENGLLLIENFCDWDGKC